MINFDTYILFNILYLCNYMTCKTDLVNSGNREEALQKLHEHILISAKGRRDNLVNEELMKYYVTDLCLVMRSSRHAKEGVIAFKNLFLESNPDLVHKVILHLIEKGEEMARTATNKANADVVKREAAKTIDLDEDETPDSIMGSILSDELARDKTDREVVVPWLKFLWDIYREMLIALTKSDKRSKQPDTIYHDVAKRALQFCRKYKRSVEFRRLSDLLSKHLAKQASKTTSSTKLHIETRFLQLEVAIEFEMWNQAFKTIELIHDVFNHVQSTLNQRIVDDSVEKNDVTIRKDLDEWKATYYGKLIQIFWMSSNTTYHAYARFKNFTMKKRSRGESNYDPAEREKDATLALIAALSVPEASNIKRVVYDDETDKKDESVAVLLDCTSTPSRASLLSEILASDLMQYVSADFKGVYDLLETSFSPLELVDQMCGIVNKMTTSDDMKQYIHALEHVIIIKLITQLSTVYSVIGMDFVKNLLESLFALTGTKFSTVENYLMQAVSKKQFQFRFDHVQKQIHFETASAASIRIETQMSRFSKALSRISKSLTDLDTEHTKMESRKSYFSNIAANADKLYEDMVQRKNEVEKRKQDIEEEHKNLKIAEEERKANEIKKMAQKQEEDARKAKEERQQAAYKRKEEEAEVKKLYEELSSGGKLITEEQIAKADFATREKWRADLRKELIHEKEDEKLKKKEKIKKLDYVTRALRIEEAKKAVEKTEELEEEERKAHAEKLVETKAARLKAHEARLKERDDLARIEDYRGQIEDLIRSRSKGFYEQVFVEKKEVALRAHWDAKIRDAQKILSDEKHKAKEEEMAVNEANGMTKDPEMQMYQQLRAQEEQLENRESLIPDGEEKPSSWARTGPPPIPQASDMPRAAEESNWTRGTGSFAASDGPSGGPSKFQQDDNSKPRGFSRDDRDRDGGEGRFNFGGSRDRERDNRDSFRGFNRNDRPGDGGDSRFNFSSSRNRDDRDRPNGGGFSNFSRDHRDAPGSGGSSQLDRDGDRDRNRDSDKDSRFSSFSKGRDRDRPRDDRRSSQSGGGGSWR